METKSLIDKNQDPKPDENNVKTYGLKEQPKEDPKPDENKDVHLQPENKQDKPKEDSPEGKKNPDADSPEGKKQDKKQPDPKPSTEKDDNKEALKISFKSQDNPDNGIDKPKADDNKQQPKVLDADAVIAFLKEKNPNLQIKSLDDLAIKQELPEAVQKFLDFTKKTNGKGGLKDFYNLQRDWKKENKDSVISEYYKLKFPNMTPEEIEDELDLVRVTAEDEEDLGERELKQRKSNFNKIYSEALSYVENNAKEFATKMEGESPQQRQLTAEEIAELHRPYWTKRDASLGKLDNFELSVDGIGDIKVPIDDEMKAVLSKNTQTLEDMVAQWQNQDKSIDTDNMVQDFLWAHKHTRNKILQSMLEQFHVLSLDKQSKKQRRVNLDDKPADNIEHEESGAFLQVSRTGGDNSQDTKHMGTPIMK